MGKKKLALERYDINGINKVLDFEDIEENATLSTVDESEGPSTYHEQGTQCRGASRDMETHSNPESNPATEEQSEEEEVEETSVMEPEGGYLKP